jgi:hypothetical protein
MKRRSPDPAQDHPGERLDTAAGGDVLLRLAVFPGERRRELAAERVRVVPRGRQSGAARRPADREGADDQSGADRDRPGGRVELPGMVAGLDKEVEDRPVVPDVVTAGRLPAQHVGQRPASAHRRAPRAASVAQPTPRRTRPERSRPTSRRPAASRPVRTYRRRRRAPRSWAGQRRPAAAATSRAAAGASSGQRARCSRTRCPSAAPRSRPYRHWVPHRCGCRARRPAPAPLSPRSRSTPPQAWFPAAGGARHPTGAPPAGAAARPGRIPAVPGPRTPDMAS